MSATQMVIPFHRPSIGDDEVSEVVSALRSGWITTGPRTAAFETDFARYVNAPHALAVNSCTAGLHLALAALGIGSGDEVITTPMTFCATVNTILQVDATPVLADIGADGNLDPNSVADRITPRTRAILPVHLAGVPCDMDRIWDLAARYRLYVVEDAAHAVGSRYRGEPIGSARNISGRASDAVAFSFYATKNLTTGEGGMVTSPHERLARDMRILCLHGISRDAWNRYAMEGNWYYEVVECGFKYNLSDIQSAIGIHQLRRQEEFIRIRTRHAQMYNETFSDIEELETPAACPDYVRNCWHLYILRLNLASLSIDRAAFIAELKRRGIGASVHFIPIPLHPAYARHPSLSARHCPRAMSAYQRILSLPLFPAMSDEEARYVAETTADTARSFRKKHYAVSAGQ